jgi:predicted amidohydrolase
MEKIKVSAVQFAFKPINDFEEFASNVENLVNQAKGSDFVIFPEHFTLELQYIVEMNKIYEFESQYIDLFKQLSEKTNQYIIAGTLMVMRKNKLYNIGHVFYPDGQIFTHAKTHLMPFEVKAGFTHGRDLEIFEIDGVKFGIGICYEMEFPEVARTYALKGAEIIFTPSHTSGEHGFWRVRHSCQARTLENQIYVIHSCLVGTPPIEILKGWGRSSILSPYEPPWSPNGVISEAEINKECVISGELDLKLLRKKRKRGVATTLKDRRPEIYEI